MADGMRLLYVDDEEDLLEIVKLFLEGNRQFTVDTVLSGPAALAAMDKVNYDAIISDYQMPGMNGIELLKKVRATNHAIPFIIFTGRGREEVVIEALNNGADFYLQKGGDPETAYMELGHMIQQAVLLRRTQMTLADQEQRYHDVQNANDLIQSVGSDGRFLFVNKKWLDTLGYREDELADLKISDVIHEESLQHCMATFRRVISGENVGMIDAVFRKRNGERVYVEGMSSCKLVEGKCQYTRGIFKDVTDRKLAEAALKESEARYRSVVEDQTEFICRFRPDGTHVFVNDAYCRYYSKTREELLGRRFSPEIPKEDRGLITQHLASLTPDHPVATLSNRVILKDGTMRWQQWSNRAIFDGSGQVTEYQSVGRDITELKEAEQELLQKNEDLSAAYEELYATEEEIRHHYDLLTAKEQALRESEEKMAMVMNGVPTLLSYHDAELRFVYMNKAHAEWYGRPEKDLIGKSLKDLLPEDVFFRAVPYYQQVLGGREVSFESETKDRNGRERVLNIRLVPHIHDNEVVGFFATLEDISDRKNTEAAFQAMVRSMVGTTGLDSLKKITENISSWLGADCVIVGEIQPDRQTVKVLSMILDGKEITDFTYHLAGTPCETVVEKGFCIYPDDVRLLFPKAKDLAELDIRGYIGTPLKNSEGAVMGVLCVLSRRPLRPFRSLRGIMDIIAVKAAAEIERMRIMAALEESEERFRMLLQHVPSVAVQGYSMDGTTQYWNEASEKLYGYSAEEAVGKNLVELIIPPEMRSEVREAIRSMAESGQPIPASELSLMKKDGSRVAVFSSHAVVRRSGGALELFCIDIDLTERKRAEEALFDEITKRRILIDQSRDGIVTLDEEGKVYESNRRFAEMLGYTPEEMRELHVWDWDAEFNRKQILEMIRTVDAAGDHFETRHRRKDGSVLDVEISTNAAVFSGKKLIFCVVRDFTERKRMEEALRQANAKLSMLNSITRHDILNQLTVLRAYLQLSKEDAKDSASLDYIDKEAQAARAIQWQIEFTRHYQDIGAQAPKWQALSGVIHTIIEQLKPSGIEIDAAVTGVEIYADPLLEKVFYNLMENSLRHGETVTRMNFTARKSGNDLIVTCADNGVGIAAKDKNHLFQKGFGKHTGLGLFLSKEILSITGMTITENGEPGQGARFEITVPKGMYRIAGEM